MSEHEKTTAQPAPEVLDPTAGRERAGYDKVPSAPPAPVYDKLKPAPTGPAPQPPSAPRPTEKK